MHAKRNSSNLKLYFIVERKNVEGCKKKIFCFEELPLTNADEQLHTFTGPWVWKHTNLVVEEVVFWTSIRLSDLSEAERSGVNSLDPLPTLLLSYQPHWLHAKHTDNSLHTYLYSPQTGCTQSRSESLSLVALTHTHRINNQKMWKWLRIHLRKNNCPSPPSVSSSLHFLSSARTCKHT